MKKESKNIFRVLISILYIIWGIAAPLTVLKALVELNVNAILSASVGVLMLLAGIFGLFGLKKGACRAFGIVIFVLAVVSIVTALPAIAAQSIVSAILAWLFIICIV